MKPNEQFLRQSKKFWANVRTISERCKYTDRRTGQIKIPTILEIRTALESIGLRSSHIINKRNRLTAFGDTLIGYFEYRANSLNNYVEPRLMNAGRARQIFDEIRAKLHPVRPFIMNKQKGEKRNVSYLTAIVNMLIEANIEGLPCDYDPRGLISVTLNGTPLRTLARRFDGAFPSTVNPIAVWEIKEYYYTTTFGSRVADGVYETLLDGMETEELREHEGIDIKHYLIVDSHICWWQLGGRSYLCRMIDMLHMGYLDEAIFGYEVVERLPTLVKELVSIERARNRTS